MWLTMFLIRPECIKNASPLECKNRLFICSFRLTRKMSFREISWRRRYVCSAHQWPFRHHHPPVAFSPSLSTRGDGALAVAADPSFQHSISYHPHSDGEAPSLRLLRTPVAFSPSSSTRGLFAITAHPWRRRPRRRGRSQLPTRHIIRTATARRRRYVCSAHQWPFRHHRTPVAFSPSSHTSGDGALAVAAVPSFQHSISSAQRRRGAVATFAPHTSSLFRHHRTPVAFFAITTHPWPFRHHRTPVATAPSPSRPFQAHSNSNLI